MPVVQRYIHVVELIAVTSLIASLIAACSSAVIPATAEQSPAPSSDWEQISTDIQLTYPSTALIPRTVGGLRTSSEQRVAFEHISVEHGLSQSSVNCILQDDKGFLWFGTNDGLNKYDGYSFTVYGAGEDTANSLSHDTITAIVEDQQGVLWIGTQDGLNRFDRQEERFTHYHADPENPDTLSHDHITALYEDHTGQLWIGTPEGLNRLEQGTGRFVRYRADLDDPHSLPDNEVLSIYEDKAGVLWVGLWNGLAQWEPVTAQFVHYRPASDELTSLGHNAVQSIVEDGAGRLWIGTGGSGFYRFDRAGGKFSRYLINPDDVEGFTYNDVKSIYEDQAGVLWIGTDGGGLYQFNRLTESLNLYLTDPYRADSLSSNYITSIYEGQTGVLWIGTWGGGINKFDRDREKFLLYQADPDNPDSLSHNRVLALFEDRAGTLWVGTDGGGLNRLAGDGSSFMHYRHDPEDPYSLSNNYVTSIYQDEDGVLWLGTLGGGLEKFDRESERFIHYQADPYDPGSLVSGIVLTIYQDREGALWIGTDEGLERFDQASGRFIHYRTSGAVWALYQDREDMLWIGTDEGLDRLDREDGRITRYQADPEKPDGLSSSVINVIHQDRAGRLWIGTAEGLNQFDFATEKFKHYNEADGLPNSSIMGILEDNQGQLWLSTAGGLSKFDPRTGSFRNYDVSDGLQGYEFTHARCKGPSGDLFFGGINGFNAFRPDLVKDNPYVPEVVLTSLTQGGKEIDIDRSLESVEAVTLRWPSNFFEFECAALNFSQPQKNRYSYKLVRFDEDWNNIGTRRFGRYTNLPGGTYTLRVIASNNDGVWNEEGVSVKVDVVPPFWTTWWFRGIIILALMGGALGGYRLRVRNIQARSRKLEGMVDERTAALSQANVLLRQEITERKRAEEALAQRAAEAAVAAERSRLARDLHDAVTQTIFSASLISEALPDIWENDQREGRDLLAEMRRLSRGALAEMRTLLLELRPSVLTETNLGDLLRQLAEAAAGREDISITVTEGGPIQSAVLSTDVHVALYRIAQEALNNVVKHARASRVVIELNCKLAAGDASAMDVSATAGADDSVARVELCVADDGCGFDVDCVPRDRLGLGNIRERAQAIGADLKIESESGHGTSVRVIWNSERG